MSLFKDTKMGCTILRNGRKKAVFERHDFKGNFVRYVTHVSPAEQRSIRKKEYRGARVGINSWAAVQPWEIENCSARKRKR